jgi:RHS repeat-associated protein
LNRQTTYEYDALGRRTKRKLPGGQSETFGHDAAGNLLLHTNFNGLIISNNYDSMNRLSSRSNGTTRLEYYVYDTAGQLTNRIDTSGSYTWVFDSRGRVRTNTTPVGTLYYGYDADGNQTGLSSATSGGINLLYQYDAFNRLTNVLDVNLGLSVTNTAYTYDAIGNLQTMKYPNGVTNLWQYDSLNRLTNLVINHNSTPLGSFYYQFGLTGIRTNLSETVNSASRNYAWAYDSIYRLTNETISTTAPTGTISYAYDAVGNRTNRNSGISGITNQTPTFNSNDWISTDGYDSNGNTTTNSSNQVYKYDYADRLTNFNGGAVTIVYDADGNRIQKLAGTTNMLYLVSAVNPTGYPQVVEEFTVSGSTNLTKVYTYGLSLISQRAPGTSTNFFGLDGHGSTRFLTDAGGNAANVFAYDAYGNLIASNATSQTAYLYCGEQLDSNLAVYCLRARLMSASTGRFLTMDTFQGDNGEPLSLHKYLYCHGNPVNHVDPSGHDLGDLMVTMQTIGYMAANIGLRMAPALTRVAIVVMEGMTGQTLILGGGAAITGYAAMSRVEGGIGSWTAAVGSLKNAVFGPAGYVKSIIKGASGQANHLNQSAAFVQIIKKAGAAVELDGNAFIAGTEHNQFHIPLERFWDLFRAGGSKALQKPTNQGYLQALRKGLTNVKNATTGAQKFLQQEIDAMVEFAEKEQRGYGYHDGPGGLSPEVPRSMNLNDE